MSTECAVDDAALYVSSTISIQDIQGGVRMTITRHAASQALTLDLPALKRLGQPPALQSLARFTHPCNMYIFYLPTIDSLGNIQGGA
jgi:hypothetical protein